MLPIKEYQRTGHAGGALRCVVRAIPVAVLRPTAGAAEALSYTLLGLRNDLDPEKRKDEEGELGSAYVSLWCGCVFLSVIFSAQ